MKIISWNVNGIRAIAKKDFAQNIARLNADVICLQEIKASEEQTHLAVNNIKGYRLIANAAERKGYSGTAVLSRVKPINTLFGLVDFTEDNEGRVITTEWDNFYLITVYVPNSGNALARLDYRKSWNLAFQNYINQLQKNKPVVVCGDFNVAHQPIDIARPKANYNRTAGYTQTEIDGFSELLKSCNLIDTFRQLHPNTVKYSWWSYRANARTKNIGWRLDYFLINQQLNHNLKEAYILNDYMGSDHCPVGIILF